MPDSVTKAPKHQPLDDETAAALTLFNTYLVADREQQAHERALKRAERVKDEAAAAVRKLNDRKASATETAEAEAAYRGSVEALRRLRDGDHAPPQDATDEPTGADEDAPEEADAAAETEDGEDAPEAAGGESVGVEASVGDDDLTGDEPAGVAG